MSKETPEQVPKPTAEALMIDDLSRRVAQTSIEAAEWRARALLAEDALEEIKAAAAEDEEQDEAAEPEQGDGAEDEEGV